MERHGFKGLTLTLTLTLTLSLTLIGWKVWFQGLLPYVGDPGKSRLLRLVLPEGAFDRTGGISDV